MAKNRRGRNFMSKMIARSVQLSKAVSEVPSVTKEELEIINSKPRNRTEAKRQLALKLRLQKKGFFDDNSLKNMAEKAKLSITVSNSLRFDEGKVDSIDTNKISDSNKQWRGKTANTK
ncbi:hypothetical protein [Proteus columbae]|uniref:hypothetical protein n=1 Tax=Proteus columbae TaxID=1987580 RepID=UPI000C1DE7B0|nr:hypothetical protein [Proteus columbae]